MNTEFPNPRTLWTGIVMTADSARLGKNVTHTHCGRKPVGKKYSFMTISGKSTFLREFRIQYISLFDGLNVFERCYLCSSAAAQPLFWRQQNEKLKKIIYSNVVGAEASIFVFSNELCGGRRCCENPLTQTHAHKACDSALHSHISNEHASKKISTQPNSFFTIRIGFFSRWQPDCLVVLRVECAVYCCGVKCAAILWAGNTCWAAVAAASH